MSTGRPVPTPQRALELAATLRWIFSRSSRAYAPKILEACTLLENLAAAIKAVEEGE